MRGTLEHNLHLSLHRSLDGGRSPGRSPGPDAGSEGDAPCGTCAEEEEKEEEAQGQQSAGGASSSRTAFQRPDLSEWARDGSPGSEATPRNEPLSAPLGTAHGKRRVADAPPPTTAPTSAKRLRFDHTLSTSSISSILSMSSISSMSESAKRLRFDHTLSSEGQGTERGVQSPFVIPLSLPLEQAECMIREGRDALQEVVSSQRPVALTTARGDEAKVHNLLRSMAFLR